MFDIWLPVTSHVASTSLPHNINHGHGSFFVFKFLWMDFVSLWIRFNRFWLDSLILLSAVWSEVMNATQNKDVSIRPIQLRLTHKLAFFYTFWVGLLRLFEHVKVCLRFHSASIRSSANGYWVLSKRPRRAASASAAHIHQRRIRYELSVLPYRPFPLTIGHLTQWSHLLTCRRLSFRSQFD